MSDKKHATEWDIDGESLQCILFKMGNEYYGLSIASVKEIIKPLPITRIPKSPPFVEGVIDLRGHILPIVNLRAMFGLSPLPLTEESRFVDIQLDGLNLGIVVEAVSEVVRIATNQIEQAPPMIAGVDGKFLKGIARLEDKLILLMDMDEVFAQWTNKTS